MFNPIKHLKINRWWSQKIGTGVFTWLLFSVLVHQNRVISVHYTVVLLFTMLILLAIFGHLINDYSDFQSDLKAGKMNLFNKIGMNRAVYILFLIGASAIACSLFLPTGITYIVIVQILCNIGYSLEPFRLKEKKWWSLVITGLYERVIPYLIIITAIGFFQQWDIQLYLLSGCYLLWAYCWECRNFINGQMNDRKNDELAGIKTLAVVIDQEILVSVKQKIRIAEGCFLIVWITLLLITFPLLTSVFLAGIACIVFIHLMTIKELYYIRNYEFFIDFINTHAFLSAFLICSVYLEKLPLSIGVILLILFTSGYSFVTIHFVYNKLLFVVSFVVNYSIYYLRRLFSRN